jgi:hypothetical protein
MQKPQPSQHGLANSAQVPPSGTPDTKLMPQQQLPTADPSNNSTAPAGAKTHVLFYRTSCNLSAQQVTLPRGIFPLAPGDSLAIQLYIAVHPQDWDSAQYVTDRTANLQDASVTSNTVVATAGAEAPGTGLAVSGACRESTHTQPNSNSSSSDVDACRGGSPQQGSCSPPPHSSSNSSSEGDGSSSSSTSTTPQLGSPIAALPADLLQRPQETLASANLSAAAAAAAAAMGWGFGTSSTLLGPFKALVKVQTGPKEGTCRLSKVQHAGQLKGIWHRPNHTLLLYEKVRSEE